MSIGTIYWLAAELGHLLSFPGETATFWIPAGVSLAAFYLTPFRWWWHLAGATLIANLLSDVGFHHKTLNVSLGFWTANVLEAMAASGMLSILKPNRVASFSPKAIVGFLVFPCLGAAAIGATLGALIVSSTFSVDYRLAWTTWCSGDVT